MTVSENKNKKQDSKVIFKPFTTLCNDSQILHYLPFLVLYFPLDGGFCGEVSHYFNTKLYYCPFIPLVVVETCKDK